MKKLILTLGTEIRRLFWMIFLLGIFIFGLILTICGNVGFETFLIMSSLVGGFGYIGSIIQKSKTEKLATDMKTLLNESQHGAPLGLMPDLDSLQKMITAFGGYGNGTTVGPSNPHNTKQIL